MFQLKGSIVLNIEEIIWDDWNTEHIKKYAVSEEEVEEVCESEFHLSKSRANTYRLIGQTTDGRYLAIFVAKRNAKKFYTVTARPATDSEIKLFKKWQKS